ncbi:MAG: three-Cys-motif partner protein TcmP [Vicingaceae bacterium]
MPIKDLHTKPFDKGTIAKLALFENYAQAWIPTFVVKGEKEIHIFDFFAGPGYDSNNLPGSPIRILNKVNEHLGNIFSKQTKIIVHFNEFDSGKFKMLESNCDEFLSANPKFNHFLKLNIYNEDAYSLFYQLLPIIDKYPSLVYLDQNGIKFISEEFISKLERLKTTDWLLYVSSSYFKRLGQTDEFKKILNFPPEELDKIKYTSIHKRVLEKVRSKLSPDTGLMLFPFSIKKGSNIYGVIFGATHLRAVDKFLEISWKKNEVNGEANFDLDDDQTKGQLVIFGKRNLTKIEKFKEDLKAKILNGSIKTNEEALFFTYETGNYYRHANELLKELKKAGEVFYEGRTPGISYNNALNRKKKRKITFQLK